MTKKVIASLLLACSVFAADNPVATQPWVESQNYLTEIGTGEQATNSCMVFSTNGASILSATSTRITLDSAEHNLSEKIRGWDYGGFLDEDNDQIVFSSSGPGKYLVNVTGTIFPMTEQRSALVRVYHVVNGVTTNYIGDNYDDSVTQDDLVTISRTIGVDVVSPNDRLFFEMWHRGAASSTINGNNTYVYIQKVSTPPEEVATIGARLFRSTDITIVPASTFVYIPWEQTAGLSATWDDGYTNGIGIDSGGNIVFDDNGVYNYSFLVNLQNIRDNARVICAAFVGRAGATNNLGSHMNWHDIASEGLSTVYMGGTVTITNSAIEKLRCAIEHTDTGGTDETIIWGIADVFRVGDAP